MAPKRKATKPKVSKRLHCNAERSAARTTEKAPVAGGHEACNEPGFSVGASAAQLSAVNSQLQKKVLELEAANNDLVNLLNCTDMAMVLLDTHLNIRRFTPATGPLLNLIASDIGRPFKHITLNLSDDDLLLDAQKVLQRLAPIEKEVPTTDGRWFLRHIRPYRAEADRIKGVVIAFADITERKRIEQMLEKRVSERTHTLHESEELVRTILDTAADGIIIMDEGGSILSFNKAAEKIFGYAPEEVVGRHMTVLMSASINGRHHSMADYFETMIAEKSDGWGEGVGRRKDGSTFPMEMAVSEVHDVGKHLFTGIVRDISERRALEREVLESVSRRQQEIGQDLHDSVGQELTGLALMAGSLKDSVAKTCPSEFELAGKIAERLKDVLGQVRALSKGLIPVEVGPEGLMAALEELAARMSESANVNCTFHCEQPVLVEDTARATHLFRIAQEAVANAVTHSRGKKILISLKDGEAGVDLAIQDDGVGIAERPAAKGGMGLQIMRYRASLINAILHVGPGVQGGTIVTCRLRKGRGKT